MNTINKKDFETVLLGVPDDSKLITGIVLDSLYSFRNIGKSSKFLADFIDINGRKLSNEKLEGILDALREYICIQPIHPTVLNTICKLVENSIIGTQVEKSLWVERAFDLLGKTYSFERFQYLSDIAFNPFGISEVYTDMYINIISHYADVAHLSDKNYIFYSKAQVSRIEKNLDEKDNLNDSANHDLLLKLKKIYSQTTIQAHLNDLSIKLARVFRYSLFGIIFLVIILITKNITPIVVKEWDNIEPLLGILDIILPIIIFILVLLGINTKKGKFANLITKKSEQFAKHIIYKMCNFSPS